ncbi:DUF1713 domain protein [Melia azedarach]|uniref:DUF1713 domain protein n=2 Tax=Melia azedarach TaxID=155640 RepID=A0ACC1XMC0_MELAZ|nr:DUF1713 domain protein [Melia azedarach]KAJ4712469.1 DUF1713 domain protein [Melia azedarach]
MMANFIQKLTRNKSTLRIFANLKTPPNLPKPTPTFISTYNPILFLDPKAAEYEKPTLNFPVFPSFPFGYCLNPMSSNGFDQLNAIEADEVETDDARTIWADSVKKKRKKKMNKHKYKKLRKRLRRKT